MSAIRKIRLLEPSVIGKIAAGEVIQRPVNVVKELIENALDAGSSAVSIEIRSGGMDFIRVTDNGCGIPASDALLAFERHATSKITSESELYSLRTLGFRGEALASIAAVSHTTLTTREDGAQGGYTVTIHGGELVEHSETGCPEGTTVIVRNLFYNTPVRRNFNQSATLEANHVGDLVARMILSHPAVSFRYISNEKVVYHSTGSGDMASALFCVYGRTLLPALIGVGFDDGYIKLYGQVSNLDVSRANRTQQSLFINGRFVRSPLVADAVRDAYGARLPKGRYPIFVLNVTIAPEEVDVNVHPAKLAVRFHDEKRVRDAAERAVSDALSRHDGVPRLFPRVDSGEAPRDVQSETASPSTVPAHELRPDKTVQSLRDAMRPPTGSRLRAREDFRAERPKLERAIETDQGTQSELAADKAREATNDSAEFIPLIGEQQELDAPIHIIGNAYETYWFVQRGKEIYVVDQHAAHERLNYDRLLASVRSGGSQQLLEPLIVRLSSAQSAILSANLDALTRLGFELDEFGPLTWRVRAIPHVIGPRSAEGFLIDALDALAERRSPELKLEALMMMACKASVKAGDPITHEEITRLFESQDASGPLTCPHGRPIMLQFTRSDLERLFKR